MALARTHPAFLRHHHCDGFVHHFHFGHGLLLFLNECAAGIGKCFGILLNLFDHQAFERCRIGQNFFELSLLCAQLFELLLNLDGFQTRQLTQANFKNVFSLALAKLKAVHQGLLRLITLANDGNHLVDVEQHQLTAFQNMDTVHHLAQAMLGAANNGLLTECDPLRNHLAQRFLHWLAINTHRGHVDGRGCF